MAKLNWQKTLVCFSTCLSLILTSSLTYAAVDLVPMKKNEASSNVTELQQSLAELGLYKGAQSGKYDAKTEVAVKNFQKSQGLSADGVAGKSTLKLIRDHAEYKRVLSPMKPGAKDAKVVGLQRNLKKLGLLSSGNGLTYDAQTQKAVVAFQKANGIKPDGIVGAKTLALIEKKAKSGTKMKAPAVVAAKPTVAVKKPVAAVKKTAPAQVAKVAPKKVVAAPKKQVASQPRILTPEELQKKNMGPSAKYSSSRGAVAKLSRSLLGTRYVYGGSSSRGFDCSGFTMYVMRSVGIRLEHGATAQYQRGIKVDKKDLIMGDLVFFKTDSKAIGHVGIYIGDNKFIHASSGSRQVITSRLGDPGYKYVGAKRVIQE